MEVANAVFHDHVLKDRVVGVEGHLGPDQAGEVGGEAEEGEQGEAEEVLASPQCEVWSAYLQGFSCTYCSDKGWLLHVKKNCLTIAHIQLHFLFCQERLIGSGIVVLLCLSKGLSVRSWIIINPLA